MVQGFKASAVASGLKKDHALDLALVFSENAASVAGVFTTNKVRAAPVVLSMERVGSGKTRAIIVNSGNANACTGESGLEDARKTAECVADALGIRDEEVLVLSTGVIGQPLDMRLIFEAVPSLVRGLSGETVSLAAQAMMTTDSFPKISRFEGYIGNRPYVIQGIAKGAGMIMPNMATMLCVVMSDVLMEPVELQKSTSTAVGRSFNRITVDGDTSTNDTVLVMANGLAANSALSDEDRDGFTNGLTQVMGELARMIVQDGEGATKVVEIRIKGAHSAADADRAARTIANSSLVKTAFYGQDPNWGRILAALGRADIQMEETRVNIWIDEIQIVHRGLGMGVLAEKSAARKMNQKEFAVMVDLQQGPYEDHIVTCDLTHDYVSINADYRT